MNKIIQINKWDEVFENADSRKRQRLGFYYMPSGCDSAGYLALMSEFEPAEAWQTYGTFVAMCQQAATMRKDVRGRFVNSNNQPMTTKQIAMLIRCDHDILLRSLEILMDKRVAWLSAIDAPPACQPSANDMPTLSHVSKKAKVKAKAKGEAQGQGEGEDASPLPTPMDNLKKKINALKTEWQKPAQWSYAEEQHLHNGCAKQMAELDEQDWKDMHRYMNAYLDQAKAYYRPNSRGRFCEQFSDVFAHMVRWRTKNKPATVAKAKPPEQIVPQKPNPDEYKDELAQYIKKTGTDMKPQQIADDSKAWSQFIHWMMNETIPN